MKKGTGDDPFADEPEEVEAEEEEQQPTEQSADPEFDMSESETQETTVDEHSLPYYQRRSSVKEDRDDVLQFFVQEDTAKGEDDLESAVADELDIRAKELYKLDLREAAFLVAMEHPEEVADKLRDWGYEFV